MIPLLVLRPERGAIATARKAEALGLSPLIRSLFVVEPHVWDAPDSSLFDALLLTSANAVRHGGQAIALYCGLPVFAVGAATAQAARDAGFANVVGGIGNAADALAALRKAGLSRPLHLAGADRTPYPPLPFPITTRVVYEAAPTNVALPAGRYAALLHSARAAAHFAERCPAPAEVDIIAMSDAVAQAAGAAWRSVHVAPEPTDNAMLALAVTLCDGATMPTGRV